MFNSKTHRQINNYLEKHFNQKQDWILTVQEAIEHGLCDGIYGEPNYESLQKIKEMI